MEVYRHFRAHAASSVMMEAASFFETWGNFTRLQESHPRTEYFSNSFFVLPGFKANAGMIPKFCVALHALGYAVAQFVEALSYKPEGCGSLRFFLCIILPAALWP
jgi:hypothetical protein